ncbi:MAG: hypothetical protein LLF76_01525 [Planctomycetaceae bacterium]|nr:hypothetical protein [Planctomycetaceae bacterium]
MKRLWVVLLVFSLSLAAQAALGLVEDFQAFTVPVNPDGKLCTGIMGGFWDTESEATGNSAIETKSGSNVIRFMTTSGTGSVSGRGVAFSDILNPLDDTESGTMFFRFVVRQDTQKVRDFLGMHVRTGTNPLGSTQNNNPAGSIAAGFAALDNGLGGYDIKTVDGSTVLMAGLVREQWYDVWIVANNATDTFDLYVAAVSGPGIGAPTDTPDLANLIADDLAFSFATTSALNGGMFVSPAATDGQSSRIYIDDIYWEIPEPMTLTLLGAGALALLRRKA